MRLSQLQTVVLECGCRAQKLPHLQTADLPHCPHHTSPTLHKFMTVLARRTCLFSATSNLVSIATLFLPRSMLFERPTDSLVASKDHKVTFWYWNLLSCIWTFSRKRFTVGESKNSSHFRRSICFLAVYKRCMVAFSTS